MKIRSDSPKNMPPLRKVEQFLPPLPHGVKTFRWCNRSAKWSGLRLPTVTEPSRTGNIVHYQGFGWPMAEYLLRKSLANRDADAAVFELASAGTHVDDGAEMDPRTVQQLVRLNVSPNGFRYHTVTAHDLDDADLILTATRAQRSMLLERLPTALRRSFTLLEFAQTAQLVRSCQTDIGAPKDLVRLSAVARGSVPVPEYDVADPVGGSVRVHRRNADVTLEAVQAISGALVRQFPN